MSNKQKRLACFIASLIVSIGIPLVVTIIKYDMINAFLNQPTDVQVSIIGAIICVAIFVVFFKKIINYLDSLSFSMFVAILKGFVKLLPLLCVVLLLANMLTLIDDLLFVFGWITGCNTISLLVLDPLTAKFNNEAKKDEQRELIKEGLTNE